MRPSAQPFWWKWVYCMRLKDDFHIKGWALNLVLKQRPGGTRKWPIVITSRIESPIFRYNFVPCRSNESKAYPLTLGDDIFDIYCVMAEAPTEKNKCGVGGWTLVMKIDGKNVYVLPTLPILLMVIELSGVQIWSEIIPIRGVASFSTSSKPGWLSLPHILKIARRPVRTDLTNTLSLKLFSSPQQHIIYYKR